VRWCVCLGCLVCVYVVLQLLGVLMIVGDVYDFVFYGYVVSKD